MTKEIDELREHLRAFLMGHPSVDEVASKSGTSNKVHLSVFRTTSDKPIGVEFDRDTLQNIWLRASDAAQIALPDLKVTKKSWNGVEWKGDDGSGANHNLKHYDDFPGHDLVRIAVKTKEEAHAVLDGLFVGRTTRHYLLKVNGELHCPNGICRPSSEADWEGGEVLIPNTGPVLLDADDHEEELPISVGDELWVWTHEDKKFGGGWGMTASATAGEPRERDGFIAVPLKNVQLLPHPFGFRDLGEGDTGCRLLNYTRNYRLHKAYQIGQGDYEDLMKVVEVHSVALSEDVRLSYAEGWEREVLNHKDDLLAGLHERKTTTQKARSGQAQFRADLMERYNRRCVVTKCAIPEALEAAHVMPHTGDPKWDDADNGLLLRRDLHSLFDAMLWSIDPKSNRMRLAQRLKKSSFQKLDGREIAHQVAPALLEVHFRQFMKGGAND